MNVLSQPVLYLSIFLTAYFKVQKALLLKTNLSVSPFVVFPFVPAKVSRAHVLTHSPSKWRYFERLWIP